jgi:hypothetical protein
MRRSDRLLSRICADRGDEEVACDGRFEQPRERLDLGWELAAHVDDGVEVLSSELLDILAVSIAYDDASPICEELGVRGSSVEQGEGPPVLEAILRKETS